MKLLAHVWRYISVGHEREAIFKNFFDSFSKTIRTNLIECGSTADVQFLPSDKLSLYVSFR